MEYFVLQNTRLSLVMRLSDIIATCLFAGIKEWNRSTLLARKVTASFLPETMDIWTAHPSVV